MDGATLRSISSRVCVGAKEIERERMGRSESDVQLAAQVRKTLGVGHATPSVGVEQHHVGRGSASLHPTRLALVGTTTGFLPSFDGILEGRFFKTEFCRRRKCSDWAPRSRRPLAARSSSAAAITKTLRRRVIHFVQFFGRLSR